MGLQRVAFVGVDEKSRAGSGYLIRSQKGDLVFTAAHVVEGVNRCEVYLYGRSKSLGATVLWRDEGTPDVAVLLLDKAVDLDVDLGAEPDWASCRNSDVECRAVGYPRFQRPDGKLDTEGFRGHLRPESGRISGRLNLVHTASARSSEDWKCMSGAALFAEKLLVGVVTDADDDRLHAWPIARLLDRPDFIEAVGAEFTKRLQLNALWPTADRDAIDCIEPWTPLRRLPLMQPSRLLRARYETVPFADELRVAEIARLQEFSDQSGSGVILVTGSGGSGKTRLMLEWCKRMRAQHWLAGFIRPGVSDWRSTAKGEAPRLLVIDYATHQLDRIAPLLHALLQARGRPQTKLVLLARQRGLWLDKLRDDDYAAELLDANPGIELAALDKAQHLAAYEAAYRSFSEGKAAPLPIQVRRHESMLIAHMQALLSVLDDQEIPEGRERVLARVLAHERKFWHAHIEQRLDSRAAGPKEAADRLGAALVLVDGVPARSELPGLARRIAPELQEREVDALRVCFAEFYSHGDRVAALEPDLLGEQLVYETLKRDGSEALTAWLELPFEVAFEGAVARTLTVLTRLGGERDLPEAREWLATLLRARGVELVAQIRAGTLSVPGVVLADAVFAAKDLESAEQMSTVIPEQTVVLREVAAATGAVIVDVQRRQAHDEASSARLAVSLNNLGIHLGKLGQREAALKATREAVDSYRELAEPRPDAFLPELATSLNNLGNGLSELGQREAALEATREAVEIRRELAEARPDAFLPDLAASLNNLGVMLSELGQREAALEATREAVDSYRKLAEARPDAFLPELATSLNNLGSRLSELGQREAALKASREAVSSYRELAEARPDAFLPDLAASLNNLGNRLSELGQREAALKASREAVEIRRELAEARPDAFLPDLTTSLNNLGNNLSKLGQREAALEATREAVEIRRELAEARPDAFLPDLAASLNNLGAKLRELGRREAALEATREAVGIRRELAKGRPDAFLPELATSLNNLGNGLSELGQREAALEATREAVEIRRELAEARPDAFLPDLAASLNNLGATLSKLGQREAALKATREAVDSYRELAEARPDAFLPDLATSLNNLGSGLSELGQREAALEASREAVDSYRELAGARPDAFLPDLAASLNNLGLMLSELGQREAALEASREAVEIQRELAEARPDAFLPDLAASLNNLGATLSELGQREAALEASREAVEIRRELAQARPNAFLPDLAVSLNNLGAALSELGQREAALEATREAVETRRELAQARPNAFLPDLAASLNNLGAMLSELGQREAAFEATREAVDSYRKLAEARPDAFLPNLAISLSTQANVLSAAGQFGHAASSFADGLRAALPLLDTQPDTISRVILKLARGYRHACDASNTEIAEDLQPLMTALALPEGDD